MAKITGNQDKLYKGEVKVKKKDKVFKTREINLNELRCVVLDDGKKTKVYVQWGDKRTDEEIRKHFRERDGQR